MSGIVRDPEKLPPWTRRVECVRCNWQSPIARIEELGDPLTCLACFEVGLVPRRHDRVADKYPGNLGERFATVPLALFDPENRLQLTSAERIVVIVLDTFRRRRDDLVFPSQELIASMTGLSRRTVQRTLDWLIEDGLIDVECERRSGHFGHNRYDVMPLWRCLAAGAERPRI